MVALVRTSYHLLMARLVFGMMQSLDGYVDDTAGTLCMPPPGPAVFRHFVDVVAGHAGAIYGRRIYELMRYWDDDQPVSLGTDRLHRQGPARREVDQLRGRRYG